MSMRTKWSWLKGLVTRNALMYNWFEGNCLHIMLMGQARDFSRV